MRNLLIVFCLSILFLSGCGVQVVPGPNARGIVNPADNSITAEKNGVTVKAMVHEMEVAPYRMVDNVTSFYVAVENGTDGEIAVPLDAFVLIDDQGNQYRPIRPAEVQQIVSRDSNYLIPYPYVGYYYLEDRERSAFFNTFESSRPFFAENYPQDLFTNALPAGDILPGARIGGDVYFTIDLATRNAVELRLYLPGTPVSAPPDFAFPFDIEKK